MVQPFAGPEGAIDGSNRWEIWDIRVYDCDDYLDIEQLLHEVEKALDHSVLELGPASAYNCTRVLWFSGSASGYDETLKLPFKYKRFRIYLHKKNS